MSVQYAQKAPKQKAPAKPKGDAAIIEKVDKYAGAKQKIDAVAPELKVVTAIDKELRAKAMEKPGAEQVVFEGTKFSLVFSEAGDKKELTDLAKAKEFLGPDLFAKVATVSLGDLEKYLTPEQFNQCVTTKTNGGSRKISLVPRT